MVNVGWDFRVLPIPLNDIAVNAGQKLGLVMVQPRYDLGRDTDPPFQIRNDQRQVQSDLIERAFQIRDYERQTWDVLVPFVLFPEYSIPLRDPNGLTALKEQMERAEGDVIFIGGLESLRTDQVPDLIKSFPPGDQNSHPDIRGDTFVNLCVIAVKSASGSLSWHYQAKIAPSQWEHRRNMALGRRVLYFHANNLGFLCQICFDHIAAQGEETFNRYLFQQLDDIGDTISLDYVFVPQYNISMQNTAVVSSTNELVKHESRGATVLRSALVMVNRAAEDQETKEYGRSGLHYKSGRWPIPKNDFGPLGYELCAHNDTTSAIFRKHTQAMHFAVLLPPSANLGTPRNLRQPLEQVRSYLIVDACDTTPCSCPRRTSHAGNYVECDCLPCKLRDILVSTLPETDDKDRWDHQDEEQSRSLREGYESVRSSLLELKQDRARPIAELLLSSHHDGCGNPDMWAGLKREAFVEMVAALSLLAEYKPLSFDVEALWTLLLDRVIYVVVADGEDKRHTYTQIFRKYWEQFEQQYYSPNRCKQPVLFVALRSGGALDDYVERYRPDVTMPQDPQIADLRGTFEKPLEPRFYMCQDRLFDGARDAPTISSYLESKMRCIYDEN